MLGKSFRSAALAPAARALARHAVSATTARTPLAAQRAPVFAPSAVWGARAFSSSAGKVAIIDDLKAFNSAVEESKGGLVVAYHTAAWCGPCKAVWPHVVEMAASNTEVSFLKIDVDEAADVAQANNIAAMPTFLLLKGGAQVDKLVGADAAGLKVLVAKHK